MRIALFACLLLAAAPAAAAPNPLSEIQVDVIEDAQPLRDVLQRLERKHSLNYVVNEKVLEQAGTVTVRLRNVPLDVALESICSACGLSLEIRGTVLVVLPKHERQGPRLPHVEEGLTRRRDEGPNDDSFVPRERGPAPAMRPRAEPGEVLSRAVGTLEAIDREEGRLTLTVDGARRNFYLPNEDEDTSGRAERLRGSIHTLKPGSRIALQYRRHPTRPVVTDLVGGAYAGTRRDAPVRRDPRDRTARGGDGVTPAGGASIPDTPDEDEATGEVLEAQGILFGTFAGFEGEVVKIKRADGAVIDCYLPSEDDAERRDRVKTAVEDLDDGKRIGVTYEDRDGKVTIQDTITQAD
jgi:hypothetical protein